MRWSILFALSVLALAACPTSECERFTTYTVQCNVSDDADRRTVPLGRTAADVRRSCQQKRGHEDWFDDELACVLASGGDCDAVHACRMTSGARLREMRLVD